MSATGSSCSRGLNAAPFLLACLLVGALGGPWACATGGSGTAPARALPSDEYTGSESENWPFSPGQVEELFAARDMEFVSTKHAGGGLTGAQKAEVRFPQYDESLTIKWKRMPSPRLDGMNNSPRRELAVYDVQKLFLDPVDYVVPTIGARCVPIDHVPRAPSAQMKPCPACR